MKYPKTKSKIVREEPDEVSMDEYAGIKETRDKPLSNEEISEFFDDLFREYRLSIKKGMIFRGM